MDLSSYQVSTLIHTDSRFSVYRARSAEFGSFLLKTSRRSADGSSLAAFARDFRIAQEHGSAGLLGARRLQVLEDGSIAQVREHCAGFSLEELLGQRLTPGPALRLMLGILDSLEGLHAAGLLHRDVRPSNFLLDEARGIVVLIDCSEAFSLAEAAGKELTETTDYHAPELRGETAWIPDRRSDFFGVGVIGYRAVTGVLPLHESRGVGPVAPELLADSVPRLLSNVLLKLLARDPGERYQTHAGLRADLERCLDEWQTLGEISPFQLGMLDVQEQLSFPNKLYGQEPIRLSLRRAYDDVREGRARFVILSGDAGAGKSALLQELEDAAVQDGALVIGGKWDQFQREGAFTGLTRACVEFVENARTLCADEFRELKRSLATSLATNAGLLIELVPELAELLPAALEEDAIVATERQKRLAFCFAELFRVMGALNRPVILALEDLHWADEASRAIVAANASGARGRRLLTVVTFRSARGSTELGEFVASATARGGEVEHHQLAPLTQAHVGNFVADTLSSDPALTEPLSQVLWRLSQGNPFSLREILTYLHGQRTLIFDAKLGSWAWDLEELGPTSVPQDVADLLVLRIQELPEKSRRAIEVGACIGDEFEAPLAAALLEQSVQETSAALMVAAELGLVSQLGRHRRAASASGPSGADFAFRHDRVRQSAYKNLREAERIAHHRRLGERLLAHHRESPALATLLEAVQHLNQAPAGLPDEPLARLNLEAAMLAKRASAHGTAAALLRTGRLLMGNDAWNANRDLSFRIVLEQAEAEYLADQPATADELFELALSTAASADERFEALQRRIQVRSNAGRFSDAAEDGVSCLRLLGVAFPARPKPFQLILPLLFILLRPRGIGSNLRLADTQQVEPRALRAMDCLANLWGPAFWSDETLTGLVVLKLLKLSLDNGNTPASSIAYACYGVFLSEALGFRRKGQSVCRLGWLLAQQSRDPVYLWRTRFMYLAFFGHYDAPLLASIDGFRESLRGSMSAGDYAYAGASANLILYTLPAVGMPFIDAHREISAAFSLAQQTEQDRTLATLEILQRWMGMLELKLAYEARPKFTIDIFHAGSTQFENERGSFYLFELSLLYLLERWSEALRVARRLRGSKMLSGYFSAYYSFYYALSLWRVAHRERKSLGREFYRCLRTIDAHSAVYAVNYRHKALLLRAIVAWSKNDFARARTLFEAALRSAREDGFPHHAAIGAELAALFFEERGDAADALKLLSSARLGFLEWGVLFKVESTERAYRKLESPAHAADRGEQRAALVPGELSSVLSAARSLSAEADASEIARKLLGAALEHTASTRAALVLARDGALVVDSEASFDSEGQVVHRSHSLPVDGCTVLPQTLLSYTQRVGTTVQLDASSMRSVFARDPYIAERPNYSFACVPLIWLNRCVGLVYLENRLTRLAFTPRKLAAAELLAAQAAATLQSAWEHRERLAVLQSRMNPHFLYNALNSIAEMTVSDPGAAETAIVRLADLYRFLTETPSSHLIRLRDELDFVRSYLQLEKLRYRERLNFEIHVEGDLDASMIPPLVLQPLVENAVHHGVASQPLGGLVTVLARISEKRVNIRVSDTGRGFGAEGRGGTGIGIATTRTRLELCFGPEAELHIINGDGAVVDLSFPLRRSS